MQQDSNTVFGSMDINTKTNTYTLILNILNYCSVCLVALMANMYFAE